MATPLQFYPHRHNKNGTYDSICLRCFATVANTLTEPELAFYDRRHICDSLLLKERYLFIPQHSQWPAVRQPLDPHPQSQTKISLIESS